MTCWRRQLVTVFLTNAVRTSAGAGPGPVQVPGDEAGRLVNAARRRPRWAPGGPYDAVIERLALYQVPDPAEVLRRQATGLRPGGLVVPVEEDFESVYTYPELPLMTQTYSWILEADPRIGIKIDIGRRLWAIAEEAGLRPLGMIGVQTHWGPGDEIGLAFMVETVRNAVPLIVGAGIATAEEIGIETYEQRLRNEWEKARAVITNATMMSAWATTDPE